MAKESPKVEEVQAAAYAAALEAELAGASVHGKPHRADAILAEMERIGHVAPEIWSGIPIRRAVAKAAKETR